MGGRRRMVLRALTRSSSMAVCLCFTIVVSGCGEREEDGVASRVPIAVFGRVATADDLRGGPVGQTGLIVDRASVRRVRVASRRYVLWAFSGRQILGPNRLAGAAFPRFCLQLVEARGRRALATQCVAREQSGVPGVLMVALSGGAEGAPGFRPREAVIAGLVPRSVGVVGLIGLRAALGRVRVRDSGFLFGTRRVVAGLVFESAAGSVQTRVDACQLC